MKPSATIPRTLMFLSLIFAPFVFFNCQVSLDAAVPDETSQRQEQATPVDSIVLRDYSLEIDYLSEYAESNGYNKEVAFMIDYTIPSGSFRFFVVDLKLDSITAKGLVCHGDCKGDNNSDVPEKFSDVSGSNCTSLGMAVIKERDYSSWGKNYKYWIDGLEETNKSMRKRVVVLHAWAGVSDEEISPEEMVMSWGCPTVSVNFLDSLDMILKQNEKVLLYSFAE